MTTSAALLMREWAASVPLAPQIEAILATRSNAPRSSLPVAALRAGMLAQTPRQRTPVVEDRRICSPAGGVPFRIYRLERRASGCLAFFHGGGYVTGGLAGTQAIVVAADYRLAPEHPFPPWLDHATRCFVDSRVGQRPEWLSGKRHRRR